MSNWVIVSWVLVAILTGVNIFVFLKLKGMSEKMLKMAFPNAKNMTEALSQMQGMMGGAGGMRGAAQGGRGNGGSTPFIGAGAGFGGGKGGAKSSDAQLKAAMEMLQKQKRK